MRVAVDWRNANTTTIDEGVRGIARFEDDGPIDSGDTHLVAIVFNPRDDSFVDSPGVKHARGQIAHVSVQQAETEHVGIGNGPRRYAHDVTHDAADARIRATERLQRRRMIVRLYLEGDLIVIGEIDDAGIVYKG